jgi:molybdate transport system substrate-binding protein
MKLRALKTALLWLLFAATTSRLSAADDIESRPQQTVTVAAAADLKFAMDEIVTKFHPVHSNIKVRVTYGSSGNFHSQLSQRAPFDIFFSADAIYPARLVEAGLARAESQFVYGIGRIVVWVRADSPIDPNRLGIESLKHSSVRKIAIANPVHAPYGMAAVAALRKLGVYESVKDRLVYGENIAQATQFVESGAADIGIIAMSLAVAPPMLSKGRYWEVPLDAYPKMEQGGVILSWTKQPKAAEAFREFVLSEPGKSILRRHGFFMPNE